MINAAPPTIAAPPTAAIGILAVTVPPITAPAPTSATAPPAICKPVNSFLSVFFLCVVDLLLSLIPVFISSLYISYNFLY